MQINVGNKIITSKNSSEFETAWMIEDAILVLEHLKSKGTIVLGGDILTENLEHNYDSWYYNIDDSQEHQFNVECSIKAALEYISRYIERNGNAYYVVIVIDRKQPNSSILKP